MLRRACLSSAIALRRRFVPPWDRNGESADAFFAGLLTSANPIQRQRREKQRAEAAEEAAVAAHQPIQAEAHRLAEMAALHETRIAEKRNFLPYGATPKKYFSTSQMAAWGEYQSSLTGAASSAPSEGAGKAAGGGGSEGPGESFGYSEETQRVLAEEMHSKIPYRYTTYIPPPPSGEPRRWPLHGTAGIVFDIDGVVRRGRWVVPGADDAIRVLQTLRIPFVFLTNGSACSEAEKARELSQLLGCEIAATQVILAHSPMRLLAPRFRGERVVVGGPPRCAEIAREYGFDGAMSILQYQAEHPEMVPFKKWAREGLLGGISEPGEVPFPPVAAVFQFSDVDDAFNDIQTTLDLLLSPQGRAGRFVSGVQTIPYFQAADDLLWSTEAPLPRLGQGAYREMLAAVFESVSGRGLQTTCYGKPRAIAFAYAEQRLRTVSEALGWKTEDLRAIFMVGDNLETDILGANAAQGLWTSVHVLSGISQAPAAARTMGEADEEFEWLATAPSRVPHYVAPTMDHFVRELLAFPEDAVLQHRTRYYGKINPIDLEETYNFRVKG
ncbi:unnamed protein product [Phytomonas sp. EM1]|nr:unnamed protein product [Phytomonas sp. EM1]|eukprot:CCW61378.1 unnamed protein product [Phytomonas sp. isolate EM1]